MTWDTTIGNGNPAGTFDYYTVAAQEIGHALGLGHTVGVSGLHIMSGTYVQEQTRLSAIDIAHMQSIYGAAVLPIFFEFKIELFAPILRPDFFLGPTEITLAGFGSLNLLPLGTLASLSSQAVDVPASFVSASPDGFALFGVPGDGTLVLSLPDGTAPASFDMLFDGWTMSLALADIESFLDDADVRAILGAQMGSPAGLDVFLFDDLGDPTLLGSGLLSEVPIPDPIPEPSTLALFGIGAGVIAWRRRRKGNAAHGAS